MRKLLLLTLCFLQGLFAAAQDKIVVSDKLEILPLTANSFIHITFINFNGTEFPCNGLVYVSGNEAVIMDTPIDDSTSEELINWMAKEYPQVKIKAVIVNHFHNDCLGGLKAFHDKCITSYASKRTIKLAKKEQVTVPQHGFQKQKKLNVGDAQVILSYHGAAHAPDNIVAWIPVEKILFGGCMVKEMNAGKGNLSDADVKKWPETIKKVRNAYPDDILIIPGHGKAGGKELLDYTIALFGK